MTPSWKIPLEIEGGAPEGTSPAARAVRWELISIGVLLLVLAIVWIVETRRGRRAGAT
jgi:hypothetical protein